MVVWLFFPQRSMGSASGVFNIILVTAVKYPAFTGVTEGQGRNKLLRKCCHHVECAGISAALGFLRIRTQV